MSALPVSVFKACFHFRLKELSWMRHEWRTTSKDEMRRWEKSASPNGNRAFFITFWSCSTRNGILWRWNFVTSLLFGRGLRLRSVFFSQNVTLKTQCLYIWKKAMQDWPWTVLEASKANFTTLCGTEIIPNLGPWSAAYIFHRSFTFENFINKYTDSWNVSSNLSFWWMYMRLYVQQLWKKPFNNL